MPLLCSLVLAFSIAQVQMPAAMPSSSDFVNPNLLTFYGDVVERQATGVFAERKFTTAYWPNGNFVIFTGDTPEQSKAWAEYSAQVRQDTGYLIIPSTDWGYGGYEGFYVLPAFPDRVWLFRVFWAGAASGQVIYLTTPDQSGIHAANVLTDVLARKMGARTIR